jgi:hypothetical protein
MLPCFCGFVHVVLVALFSSQVGLPSTVDAVNSRRWFDVISFVEGVLNLVFAMVILWSVLWNWLG